MSTEPSKVALMTVMTSNATGFFAQAARDTPVLLMSRTPSIGPVKSTAERRADGISADSRVVNPHSQTQDDMDVVQA